VGSANSFPPPAPKLQLNRRRTFSGLADFLLCRPAVEGKFFLHFFQKENRISHFLARSLSLFDAPVLTGLESLVGEAARRRAARAETRIRARHFVFAGDRSPAKTNSKSSSTTPTSPSARPPPLPPRGRHHRLPDSRFFRLSNYRFRGQAGDGGGLVASVAGALRVFFSKHSQVPRPALQARPRLGD